MELKFSALVLLVFAMPMVATGLVFKEPDTCVGDIDIRNQPGDLIYLKGCGVIEGYLQIVLIDNALPHQYENMTFPKLREITGYLLLFRVANLTTISHMFPNLAVIRGEQLLSNYALTIYEMFSIETIGLRSLIKINRGAVRIEKNPNLCYLDKIWWPFILDAEWIENNFIEDNKNPQECLTRCPDDKNPNKCRRTLPHGELNTLCWDNTHCQKVCPANCPDNCDDSLKCCHSECIGGCSGPTAANCTACRDYLHKGLCVNSCPEGTFKYKNRHCIPPADCPSSHIIFNDLCIEDCPFSYTKGGINGSSCVECDGVCPKTCRGVMVRSIAGAEMLKGCTKIEGALELNLQAGPNTVRKLEEYLGLIEEITGSLNIIRMSSLVSLSFFKSLKVIRGEHPHLTKGMYSMYILDNRNLVDLFEIEEITNGSIFFSFNPKLCYHIIADLAHKVTKQGEPDLSGVSKSTNGNIVACSLGEMEVKINVLQTITVISWSVTEKALNELGDGRNLLGFIVAWREAPFRNISTSEGEEACGESFWESEYEDAGKQPSKQHNILITSLKPWTQYALYVKSYTLSGTSNGLYSDIRYFSTKESAPSSPTSLTVEAKSPSVLRALWHPPKDPNGNVTRYKIRLRQQPHNGFSDIDFCEGTSKLPTLTNHNPPTEPPGEKEKNTTGNTVSCAPEKEAAPEEDTAHNQIAFENALHNTIYVKRTSDSNSGTKKKKVPTATLR